MIRGIQSGTPVEQRRLAAVVFIDLVGYSTLMQESEGHAQKSVERLWGIARPHIRAHGGEEIRLFGDGMLLLFPGTLAAAHCALAIFDDLAQLNRTLADATPIQARIGLHLDEVGYRDGEIFGDGVNIAARLVDIAPPGGVALSPQVHEQLGNTLSHPQQSLGQKNLKNVHKPMEVFCLPGPECSTDDLARAALLHSPATRRWRFGLASFDEQTQILSVCEQEQALDRRSTKVLLTLLQHAGDVVSRQELREAAGNISDSALTRAVERLRKALRHTKQSAIKTHPGTGYRLSAPVSVEAAGNQRITQFDLRAGDRPPLRPLWQLKKRLSQGGKGEVWLGQHSKTREQRLYKFALDDESLSALKREIALSRVLQSAAQPEHFIRVQDWNLERPPYFIECEYAGSLDLPSWADTRGGLHHIPEKLRLELATQIAEALASAHSVGVLHKDLKPADVLIHEEKVGQPRVRLADFRSGGVIDAGLLDQAEITQMGFSHSLLLDDSKLGTPMYFAPEILAGQTSTVQADVYAMGVILYQLLAGDLRKPLSNGWEADIKEELLREDIAAATQGEPARRLSSAAELAARLRQLAARREALQQQRAEQAAAEAARREAANAQQQIALFHSRRRWGLALVATLSFALLVTLQQQRSTYAAKQEALSGTQQAQAARQEAERAAREAQAVAQFLSQDLFAQISEHALASLSVEDLLTNAANSLTERTDQLPAVAAQLHQTLGDAFLAMQRPLPAEQQFALALRAYEASNLSTTSAGIKAASSLLALKIHQPKQIPTLLPRMRALLNQGQRQLGEYAPAVLQLQEALAKAQLHSGHWTRAITALQNLISSLEKAPDPVVTRIASASILLGRGYHFLGRYQASIDTLQTTARALRNHRSTGEKSRRTLAWLEQEAWAAQADPLHALGRVDEAALVIETAQDLLEPWVVNRQGPMYLSVIAARSKQLWLTGQAEAARRSLEAVLARLLELPWIQETDLTFHTRWELAQIYAALGEQERALTTTRRALATCESAVGDSHPQCLEIGLGLSQLLLDAGQPDQARLQLRRLPASAFARIGTDHPYHAMHQRLIGLLALQQGEHAQAEEALRKALQVFRLRFGHQHRYSVRGERELARLDT